VVADVRKGTGSPLAWTDEISGIGPGCSEARRARNAELGIRPNSVCSVLPEGSIIINRLRRIEYSTIRSFVRELQRNCVISPNLISQVDVGKCNIDIHCSSTVWKEILFGRVLTLEKLLREINVGVEDVDGVQGCLSCEQFEVFC